MLMTRTSGTQANIFLYDLLAWNNMKVEVWICQGRCGSCHAPLFSSSFHHELQFVVLHEFVQPCSIIITSCHVPFFYSSFHYELKFVVLHEFVPP